MNITRNQWIAIAVLALSIMMGATAQLTELFGAANAKYLVTGAGLVNSFLAGIQLILGGQGTQVKDVLAMPGIQKVEVNAMANPTLAAIAVDPNVNKIAPTPNAQVQVESIAKGV